MPLVQLSRIGELPPAPSARARAKGVDGPGWVFVIDDDDLFRQSIERLLRSARLKVKAFASAEEFLRSKRPDMPACVVLDVQLPGMSGLDLQRRMVESRVEIPIIFVTGRGDVRMGVSAMKEGAVEFLTKPFSDQELIEAVRNGIERNRTARQLPTCAQPDLAGRSTAQDDLDRLAGEIHDGVAQYLSAIHMQLAAAKCSTEGDWRSHLDRAIEMAGRGLAEARRCAHGLRSSVVQESPLRVELQRLAERWEVDGKCRCQFKCDRMLENKLSSRAKHELLRIAQEATHNAARHANPTLILLTLRWCSPNAVLQIVDNGKGISADRLQASEGFGLCNMRKRAEEIGAKFQVLTAPGQGTSITVTLPLS